MWAGQVRRGVGGPVPAAHHRAPGVGWSPAKAASRRPPASWCRRPHGVPALPTSIRPAPTNRSSGKALRREPECLGELAGKDLEPGDERQLDDLGLAEVLADARDALVGDLEVVAGGALAELEGGLLALGEVRVAAVVEEIGQLLGGD